jgi:hypothetical protein
MQRHARKLTLTVVLIGCVTAVGAAGPDDGVLLLVNKGPTPDAVTLSWTGGGSPFQIFRSADPISFDVPGDLLAATNAAQYVDAPPPASIWFYSVAGKTCQTDGDCTAGSCVDGVCCDGLCSGDCRACNLLGFGGTCTFVDRGGDPDDECFSEQRCDGTGACADFDAEIYPGPSAEPFELSYSLGSQAPVVVLDWSVADGGASDGLSTIIEGLEVRVGGTGDAADHDWSLQGLGADGATGVVSGSVGEQSIVFSPLNIGIYDSAFESFALRVQWASNPQNTVDQDSFELRLHPEDLTTGTGTQMANSLPVTNGGGLTYIQDFTISLSGTGAGCEGEGTAQVHVTGGLPPLSFWWDPIGATTANITGLVPGTYTVTVQDGSGQELADALNLQGVCSGACPLDNVYRGAYSLPTCDGTLYGFPVLKGGDFVQLDVQAGKTYDLGTCNLPGPPYDLFDTVLTVYSNPGGGFFIYNDDLGPGCPLNGLLSGVSFTSPFSGSIDILVDKYEVNNPCDGSSSTEGALLSVACTP